MDFFSGGDPTDVGLFIAGASVRAAAQSAQRAGFHSIVGADLFGDHDLRRCVVRNHRVDTDYGNLADLARTEYNTSPTLAWMYTGALENCADVVDAVPIPLLGNASSVLREIRNPWLVAGALRNAYLPVAELATADTTGDDTSGQKTPPHGWIRKPTLSSAGHQVERCASKSELTASSNEAIVGSPDGLRFVKDEFYLQEFIVGSPVSGLFVAARGQAVLLGVTRQLSGIEQGGTSPFGYSGSVGPLPLGDVQAEQWRQVGETLAAAFSLSGLFGVDAIETPLGFVPVEVNPRYPASAEVIDRASHLSSVRCHVDACLTGVLPPRDVWRSAEGWAGKLYVFAKRSATVGTQLSKWFANQAELSSDDRPTVADLPSLGTPFEPGWPVATALAGPIASERQVMEMLMGRASKIHSLLEYETT